MIWNEAKECMSRDELASLQSARLVKLVDRVYHNVEFYRKKMQQMGIEPGDIKGIEDITKLPFTTKADLRDNYPFGLFAGVSRSALRSTNVERRSRSASQAHKYDRLSGSSFDSTPNMTPCPLNATRSMSSAASVPANASILRRIFSAVGTVGSFGSSSSPF